MAEVSPLTPNFSQVSLLLWVCLHIILLGALMKEYQNSGILVLKYENKTKINVYRTIVY